MMDNRNTDDIKYATKEYWEKTCGNGKILGNTWGTRWKAWTKLRYQKYYQLTAEYIHRDKIQKILDIGCSDGDFLHYIHKKNKNNELWGVDVSASAIKELKIRFPDFCGVNCSVEEIDTVLESKFDVVFCTGTLQCLEGNDYGSIFYSISKVMHDKGVFLIEYPDNMTVYKEHLMISHLRKNFYVFHQSFEYGGWYIDLFKRLWKESFALEHPNTFLWILTFVVLSNYPLAAMCEKITQLIGHKRHGISGKILLCRKNDWASKRGNK